MAGINLSQSIQEKQAIARGTFFDKGFFVNFSIFILVAGLYGGSYWYLGMLEDDFVALQADVLQRTDQLKGPSANSAADLRVRLDAISLGLSANPDPSAVFKELEMHTVPSIRLTHFVQTEGKEGGVVIRGVTANLRYLAQQMLSYKKMALVSAVHAQEVKYNKAGQIEFELRLALDAPTEKQNPPL